MYGTVCLFLLPSSPYHCHSLFLPGWWCDLISALLSLASFTLNAKKNIMSDESSSSGSIPSSWKLPDGIEKHLERGLMYSAAGAVAGGLVGLILFKSGKGMRAASVAGGFGVGVGSTVELARYEYDQLRN
jgi:hypothetical protein